MQECNGTCNGICNWALLGSSCHCYILGYKCISWLNTLNCLYSLRGFLKENSAREKMTGCFSEHLEALDFLIPLQDKSLVYLLSYVPILQKKIFERSLVYMRGENYQQKASGRPKKYIWRLHTKFSQKHVLGWRKEGINSLKQTCKPAFLEMRDQIIRSLTR